MSTNATTQSPSHDKNFEKQSMPKVMETAFPANITENVFVANANCPDERTKFIFESLVTHLHAFIRETSLSNDEWITAIDFLTKLGKMSTEENRKFNVLANVLGVSNLMHGINNAKPPEATESTFLGPFYTQETHEVPNGGSIASEGKGDYMFVEGRVLDTKGNPISGAVIDAWESDGFGSYDVEDPNREGPDCRGRLVSAEDGSYSFRAVVPAPYKVSMREPVKSLLDILGRHSFRPAHLHIRIEAPGFEDLVTALHFEGDPYLTSDVIFGVRSSLIVKPELVTDEATTRSRGFPQGKNHTYVTKDFVLATPEEGEAARKRIRRP